MIPSLHMGLLQAYRLPGTRADGKYRICTIITISRDERLPGNRGLHVRTHIDVDH